MQLVSDHVRGPKHIERPISGNTNCAQLICHAQAAKQLHAATIRQVHFGMFSGAGISLEQYAPDCVVGQLESQRHSDRAAAGDDDR
jgi:hypothetical protein